MSDNLDFVIKEKNQDFLIFTITNDNGMIWFSEKILNLHFF
jgi:hypothetical protein